MNEYRFKFLGKWWNEEDGFVFSQDPSIELKRNFDDRAIYEKPYLDFTAIGKVYEAIETIQLLNICANLDFQIYKDGTLIWDGNIKTSNIKDTINSTSVGCEKQVEVYDKNFNTWIKSYEGVKVDVDSVFDLDCNITTIPETKEIELFETTNPSNVFNRQLYKVGDIFAHLLKIISKGNILLVSDWFNGGSGTNIMFGNGEMIASESSFEKPVISYKDTFNSVAKYYNLWVHYFQSGGKQYARIEPYQYFFGTDKTTFKNVANIEHSSNLEKLYATARVGDTQEVEDLSYANFKAFEFNNFRQQIVNVSNDCSWDTELDLTGDIVVDSDKINFVVTSGDPDGIYKETLFLIETDGTKAIQNSFSGISYYNQGLLNSSIIKRYYDGISPISVFPENFDDIDYFDGVVNEYTPGSGVPNYAIKLPVVGTGEILTVTNLRLTLDNILYDFNGALNTDTYFPNISGYSLTARDYTVWVCTKSSNYKFDLKLLLNAYTPMTVCDPIHLKAVVYHTTSSGTLINRYESDYVDMGIISGSTPVDGYKKKLNYTTPDISINAGEKIYVKIESIPFFGQGGNIRIGILGGSEFKSAPCANFKSEHQVDGVKNLFNETEFEQKLSFDQFQSIRSNPTNKVEVISNPFLIDGYFRSIKYNFKTAISEVELISAGKFSKF